MYEAVELVFVVISCCLSVLGSVQGGEIENLKCQVCRAVVDETLFRISIVDPKRTIEVGSFRVDSHGNQARYEVPYAGSETHLTELFEEELCTHMHNYGEITDDEGRTSIVRMSSKEEKPVKLAGVKIDADRQKKYVAACQELLEEHDEEMMVVFKKTDVPQFVAEQIVCVDISGFCTPEDLVIPMPSPTLEEQEDNVIEDLEKRLAETAPKSPEPVKEDGDEGQTDGQTDKQTDAPTDTDKTEL